jgi:hypothetical protein
MDEELKEKVRVKAMSSLLHRNVLGALGMLLPVFSIIGGLFVRNKPESWWYSISVTYYITPALPIILGSCGIFLLCYRSYEKIDTIINVLSGIFAFGVVLFPCANPYGIERVGYFQLPVGVSDIIHCASAMILFALLAFNIGWLFTRGQNQLNNKIYKVCAWTMITIMALFVILSIVRACGVNIPGFLTMIVEAVLLLIFGFAWLVKGRLFKFN